MADALILREVLKAEVEEYKIKRTAFHTFKQKVPFSTLLTNIEETVLKDFQSQSQALSVLPEKELPQAFAKLKKGIAECEQWLKYNRIAYERAHLEAGSKEIEESYRKLVLQLKDLSEKMDYFLPRALSVCSERPLPNLLENALKASEEIAPYLAKSFSTMTDDPEANAQILKSFVEKKNLYFKQICAYAAEHLVSWGKIVVKEGRGLFIQVPSLSPFPLIYSLQGNLYLILDIAGLILGGGAGKLTTRCIDLLTGEVCALLKPRVLTVQESEEEEKQKTIKWNFQSTWKESEFLLSLMGCQGVLQLKGRFVFEKNSQRQLYLIEQLYSDGSLASHLDLMIKHKKPSFSLSKKLRLTRCLLNGLKNIHEKHIIHGDIKLDNILLSLSEEIAVIADFNGSFLTNDSEEKLKTKTVAPWCAPELADAYSHLDRSKEKLFSVLTPAIDVWAMGLVFYMLLYEQSPPWMEFEEESRILEHLTKLESDWLPFHPGLEDLHPWLRKMLEPNPKNRCTAAASLALFEATIPKMGGNALS